MQDNQSRIEGARHLQKEWFGNRDLAKAVARALDAVGFSGEYVQRCVALGEKRPAKAKALKDAVWGMMEFDAAAMRLIDSPILQRLRHIRQLGFSYLTYLSAEHSRFPHSLGMAHVVSSFVKAIDRPRPHTPMQPGLDGYKTLHDLDPLKADDLIHAALLHDVGHMPFSHASEAAIDGSPNRFTFGGASYEEFKDKAGLYLKTEISLSEALSLLFILSPRFIEFYSGYVQETPDTEAIFRIACLVAGQRVLPNCSNIQDIISSSSVDSDKIDYVSRDALACGIPVGVDVARVFLGSGIIGIQGDKASELGYSANDRYVFSLNASGWDTFDEIIRARSMLYQRVYLHAVTRTAEAIFARALRLDADRREKSLLRDALKLWAMHDDATLGTLSTISDKEVRKLGQALRDRNLPKKACALGGLTLSAQVAFEGLFPSIFAGPENVDAEVELLKLVSNPFLLRFTRGYESTIDSVAFENDVQIEAGRIADLLKQDPLSHAPQGKPSDVVLIEIASLDRQRKSEAPVYQHGELLSADAFTNVRGVSDASDHFRQIGYVMAPPEWRELVCVATRTVLYRQSLSYPYQVFESRSAGSNLKFSIQPHTILDLDSVVRRTGLPRATLERTLSALAEVGYFDEFPVLAARTEPASVATEASRLRKYAGEDGWSIDEDTVAAFVDQFPPRLRSSMIECLGGATYLDKHEVDARVTSVVRALGEQSTGRIILVPLSPSSGGSLWGTLKSSLKGAGFLLRTTLSAAIRDYRDGDMIALVDDNAASGTQSSAQLYKYMGIAEAAWPKDLRGETGIFDETLSPKARAKVANLPFVICVALGHNNAKTRLARAARDLGLNKFGGLHYRETIGSNVAWPSDLREFLISVGRDLVAWDRWGKPYATLGAAQSAICDKHAFGYNMLGGLTFLPTNVPTSTVTALWLPGFWNGRPWVPLAIRWGRLSRATLA